MEIATRTLVFHFNKKHLEDPTIPMWVLKYSGKTLYVNHVSCNMPWSTKETLDNSHTKGAIKFKNVLVNIDENNHAQIGELPEYKKYLLKYKKNWVRIIWNKIQHATTSKYLEDNEIEHSPVKILHGSCGSRFYLCDILDAKNLLQMELSIGNQFRRLNENEPYFAMYEDPGKYDADHVDYRADDDDEDENEDGDA